MGDPCSLAIHLNIRSGTLNSSCICCIVLTDVPSRGPFFMNLRFETNCYLAFVKSQFIETLLLLYGKFVL